MNEIAWGKFAHYHQDETDLDHALSNIRILIKEYRTKYDIWYEEIK